MIAELALVISILQSSFLTGVGVGLRRNLPVWCVKGTAYWATDRNVLFKCIEPNDWERYYRPYSRRYRP